MSTANTTQVKANGPTTEVIIVAYFSLFLVIVGTTFNFLTFIIFCQRRFRDTRARPVLHYMRVIAIFDILMLYGWNLDHYVYPIYGFYVQRLTVGSCKLLSFLNYFAAQSSAWLRVFICLDRYLSLSRLHRTWFSDSKHILMIITSIMVFFTLLNLHFIIFACYYTSSGTVSISSSLFVLYPTWDYVNLTFYNFLPFILMVTLNSGVIYHLINLRRTTTLQNSRIQHRAISITLVITTFLFLMMTVPSTVAFAFFCCDNMVLLRSLDCILYSYHILSFPLYIITFDEFRQEFIAIILCKKNYRRIGPQTITVTQSLYRKSYAIKE
ncbi:unnamed protein product [Adineta ricciae]|uniref:G-protein coupled receptors family 1 profile domain-containing protein n=1 Tax=Adineta ricciae TaxID=249248 RepID=A0A815E113_ADIRI|nr:unnamed protein product [Adineta ricciae]CAF1305201.1 unnamed protein product [Adineta ricciae]